MELYKFHFLEHLINCKKSIRKSRRRSGAKMGMYGKAYITANYHNRKNMWDDGKKHKLKKFSCSLKTQMSFEQDWTPVILRKDKPKEKIQHASGFKKQQNIMSDDPDAPKTLGREAGQKILKARNDKGLTQVDLARQLNLQANVIRDYECGNIVPDKRILRLIGQKLGIKINY